MTICTIPENESSASRLDAINAVYTPKQAEFIRRMLSEEDLDAIDHTEHMGPEDYLIIARVNRLVKERPKTAQRLAHNYTRVDMHHFLTTQEDWLKEESDLVRQCNPKADAKEMLNALVKDFNQHQNGVRFALYYRIKHRQDPSKVRFSQPRA